MANPMNFGDSFLTYGPGLASLWGGEQAGLSFDQQRADKAKTLEDIATAQQTRQHDAQMQPYKLDEAKLKNEKSKQEMSAAKLSDFTDAIYQDVMSQGNMQGPPDMVGNAARWSSTAQAMGLDPEDYRVKVVLGSAAQGPQGLSKIRESLYRMSQKGFEKSDDAARQKATDEAAMAREVAGNTSREKVGAANNATQIEVANIRKAQALATAQAKGTAGATAAKNRNFQQAWQYYREAAMAAYEAGDTAKGQMFEREAEVALQAAMTAPGSTAVKPGTIALPPGSGLEQAGPVPVPKAPPLAPTAQTETPTAQFDPNKQYTPAEAKDLPKGTKFKGTDGKTYEVQ